MVVFPPACIPALVHAYSSVPLLPAVKTQVLHDWAAGGFYQFRNPRDVLTVNDRQDFHELSHYQMRQRLDAEGQTDGFVLIDGDTAENGGIWWITSSEESVNITRDLPGDFEPPITYPGEDYALWKLHIRTQDLPFLLPDVYETDYGAKIWWGVRDDNPYDPHDPQPRLLDTHADYCNKTEAYQLYWVTVTARPGEWESVKDESYDPPLINVRLTEAAAKEAGLTTGWNWWEVEPPVGESMEVEAYYDWNSPLWAWDEVTARRLERLGPRLGKLLGRKKPGSGCKGWESDETVFPAARDAMAVMPLRPLESGAAVS
ncbi:MAG: hypothetical protein Q9183_001952 [Haloplaca sp. 2 TL-2023]